jgi:hypothetical protein
MTLCAGFSPCAIPSRTASPAGDGCQTWSTVWRARANRHTTSGGVSSGYVLLPPPACPLGTRPEGGTTVGRSCWKSAGTANRIASPTWIPAECSMRPCHQTTSPASPQTSTGSISATARSKTALYRACLPSAMYCTGSAQIVGQQWGQVQASDRDSRSKHWAKSRNSGQPCGNHLPLRSAPLVLRVSRAFGPGPPFDSYSKAWYIRLWLPGHRSQWVGPTRSWTSSGLR